MEHHEIDFSFLRNEDVVKHFADTNIELLSGKHIQRHDGQTFKLLDVYFDEMQTFYRLLYKMELKRMKRESEEFFFLDFPIEGKGKLYHSNRHKELRDDQVIVGLILLKMYHNLYFEMEKIISWSDIKALFEESDNSADYKLLFFGKTRQAYSDNEWKNGVITRFRSVLNYFDRIGWTQWVDKDHLNFRITPAFSRFEELYSEVILNFPDFIQKANEQEWLK